MLSNNLAAILFMPTPPPTGPAPMLLSATCAGPRRHHKVRRRRTAHVLDAVLFIRLYKPNRSRTEALAHAVNGQFHRALADQPHFRVRVMVRGMRHRARPQRGLVHFDGSPG